MMSKKMWGGRFKKKTDKDFEKFSKSIHYDYNLAGYDIFYSLVHVMALKRAGIITAEEEKKLLEALKDINKDRKAGKIVFNQDSEDIHTEIQNMVWNKVGKLADKLHSLRSRNDQVVFDQKWYCLSEAITVGNLLKNLVSSLEFLSKKYSHDSIPGYTHTQRAQVVPFRSYLEAFCFMFARDSERVRHFYESLVFYIGAGALAGSGISEKAYEAAIEDFIRQNKGYKVDKMRVVKNSLDNVSDRDFIIEFLSILAIIQMHLSRVAEDFILYSTNEFDFLDLPEEFCTGSSLMPHKKNPDFLELVRGSTGKVYGNLMAILTTMKGLPLTYNRDMQMDKEPLFSSVDTLKDELKVMSAMVKKIKLNKARIKEILKDETLYATELAEYLVFKGVSFREAHDTVGKLVRYAQDKGKKIKEMDDKTLKKYHGELNQKVVKKIMSPEHAISSKKSIARKNPKK